MSLNVNIIGAKGRIRTCGEVSQPDYKTGALDHSATLAICLPALPLSYASKLGRCGGI